MEVDDPWTASGVVVRRAHAVRLREEGHRQSARSDPEHEHGGQDLRGRHPDGGGRRVQERPPPDGAAQGVPRLPAGALRDGRRVVVLRAQHAGRHRLRRPEPPGPEADPALTGRGGHVPRRQGRRRRAVGAAEAEARLRRRRERPGSRRDRSPTSRARSPRSTPITSSSRFSSTSSGARRSSRWTSARSPSSDELGRTAAHDASHATRDGRPWQRRNSRRS